MAIGEWGMVKKFLPNSNAGRIIFHKGILAQTATADGLIDPNLGWWNLGLIDQCFYPLMLSAS